MQRCLPNNAGTGWVNGNMSFMGLSMRTHTHRYTEWHAWKGGETLKPDWDDGSTMIELYDHTDDPPESSKISFEQYENVNIAQAKSGLVKQMGAELRMFFEKHAAADARRQSSVAAML